MKKDVLILGGGLAGLSAAYHLRNSNYAVIEREAEVGGTARSFYIDGFTFDFTGHLLHLHNPYTKKLITNLLEGKFFKCQRNAWIFSHNTLTRYPFQANTKGLPEDVVNECVMGFFEAYKNFPNRKNKNSFSSFKEWCEVIFGEGISKHFMIPYNEKLYQTPADKMTTDWCGNFVPQPKLEEVIKGALVDQKKEFGYNTEFLYPKTGGIQVLPKNLAKNLTSVLTNTQIKSINLQKKIAILSDGQSIEFKHLINTIPLVEFLKLIEDLPQQVQKAKTKLKAISILNINLGIKRPKISDKSWIYFPEDKYIFYRIGFPMNFTPHVVPKGCSSMYVEIPLDITKPYNKKALLRKTIDGLVDSGILKKSDKIAVSHFLPIRYAYVIYDHARTNALHAITQFLSKKNVQTIGRYGAWKYSFMEEAILDGKNAAEKIS